VKGDAQSARDVVEEHHIRVPRTARYYLLRTGAERGMDSEIWVVLHGYRQLARRFVRRFAPLATGARTIVAPEALSRFYIEDEPGPHGPESRVGATWMTREDRLAEIGDYVEYLDELHATLLSPADRRRVTVLGFSQGAATVSRWAALGRARIDRLILWSGALAHDLDLRAAAPRLRTLGLTYVIGRRDGWAGPDRLAAEHERLRTHDIPYRLIRYDGGHEIEDDPLRRLARESWERLPQGLEEV
jgi:predicted esterase